MIHHISTFSRPLFSKLTQNSTKMAHSSTTRWEAPKFSFNADNQPAAWREFYIRALEYLETLDTDPEEADQTKKGWK